MKTENLRESLGYVKAIKNVLLIIDGMEKTGNKMIDSTELISKIIVGKDDLNLHPDKDDYTIDMIDVNNPTKIIAGEDALMLNPTYLLNLKS